MQLSVCDRTLILEVFIPIAKDNWDEYLDVIKQIVDRSFVYTGLVIVSRNSKNLQN